MKQKIDPSEIRKGDKIRVEDLNENAWEFRAQEDGVMGLRTGAGYTYLLERPEPPFEPHWGMVIGEYLGHEDSGGGVKAVYVPANDGYNWFSHPEPGGRKGIYYFEDSWAKQKLTEGWVVIEKPEDVK